MKNKLRIVFMGTPEFAVASLEALIDKGFEVAAVVTSPDKPAGRGKKLTESAVKKYAVANGLKVFQPTNLKSPEFIDDLLSLNANLGVVVAFRMIPEIVWQMPECGTFNLHASLLPNYRGAAPINHVIINGEYETGVTTFFLTNQIDTGHIIFQEKTPVLPGETAGELHDRLMRIGADLVVKTSLAIQNDDYPQINQALFISENQTIKPAPKILKENCRINWENSPEKIYNLTRGLCPSPGAFSHFVNSSDERIHVKIFKVTPEYCFHNHRAGEIESDNKDLLSVWVKNGKIIINELQIDGKKRMQTKDFMNGFQFSGKWKMD